jgi:hypothetical protein
MVRDPAPHGTRARYGKPGVACRCAKCTSANTEYMRRYRSQRQPRLRWVERELPW